MFRAIVIGLSTGITLGATISEYGLKNGVILIGIMVFTLTFTMKK